MGAFQKKTWGVSPLQCAADHFNLLLSYPRILAAYICCCFGDCAIEPKVNESVMLTVNSVNQCPYCTGLHGQLARMAGVDRPVDLLNAKGKDAAVEIAESEAKAAVAFAYTFASNNGRGNAVEQAFNELRNAESFGRAQSIRALCWFLFWGSTAGNTINSFFAGRLCCNTKEGSWFIMELLFVMYYGPLYVLIAVVMTLLKVFPTVPAWFSALFGAILWTIASVWIIPAGVVSAIFAPFYSDPKNKKA